MKKIVMAAAAAALMATTMTAAPITGEVLGVKSDRGDIKIRVKKDSDGLSTIRKCVGTDDAIKAMAAVAMTAKASGDKVTIEAGTINSETGWVAVEGYVAP